MASSAPNRFVVVERPYYLNDTAAHPTYLDQERNNPPGVGDIVEAEDATVDNEGDRRVEYNGAYFHIADEALVSIDALIKSREARANPPLPAWERELLGDENAHDVTLAEKVIRPNKLADVLKAHGMSNETIEALTAIAVLRSLS